jgi:hypothetical protein
MKTSIEPKSEPTSSDSVTLALTQRELMIATFSIRATGRWLMKDSNSRAELLAARRHMNLARKLDALIPLEE